ncbi:MAG: hypothetical protein HQL32_10055 [Planctomycetes bacterium]|nr:hypothetical protein [Planctomycetota bacterium]
MADVITIFESWNVQEVYLKKALLAENGIQSYIEDEHMTQISWHLANAIGGVKLKVLSKCALQASQVLGTSSLEAKKNCPECGSEDILFDQYHQLFSLFLSLLLFLAPIAIKKNKWRCKPCLHIWQEQ